MTLNTHNGFNLHEANFGETITSRLTGMAPPVVEAYDTSTPEFHNFLDYLRSDLEQTHALPSYVDAELRATADLDDPRSTAIRTGLKIIQGERDAVLIAEILRERQERLTITVVQPMFREAERLRPRTANNPHGEDSLIYKLNLFEAMQAGNPDLRIRVLMVDDGCDGNGVESNKSALVAQKIINQWQAQVNRRTEARVIRLEDGIRERSKVLPEGLESTKDSVKGGAVLYGMNYAAQEWETEEGSQHIVVSSDTDLSVHPAQLPSLVLPVVKGEAGIAAASRREPSSVAIIGPSRNSRGRLYIGVWRKLLPDLCDKITDVNRGFLAVDAKYVPSIVSEVGDRKISHQLEMLLTGAKQGVNIKPVPVSYIDSEAMSTLSGDGAQQTYFDQAIAILGMAKRHGQAYDQRLARIISDYSARTDGEYLWAKAEAGGDVEQLLNKDQPV